MINTDRLKLALQARGITVEQASESLGINPSTFYRKLTRNGKTFSVEEVQRLAKLLNLDSETLQQIFFDTQLAETQV